MLKLNLLRVLILLPVLLLSACAVKPPDVPVCAEIAITHGHCIKIISGETFEVDETRKFNNKTWWGMRPAMIQVPASSWAQIKIYIINACKKYGNCQAEISNWERTVNTIDQAVPKLP